MTAKEIAAAIACATPTEFEALRKAMQLGPQPPARRPFLADTALVETITALLKNGDPQALAVLDQHRLFALPIHFSEADALAIADRLSEDALGPALPQEWWLAELRKAKRRRDQATAAAVEKRRAHEREAERKQAEHDAEARRWLNAERSRHAAHPGALNVLPLAKEVSQ